LPVQSTQLDSLKQLDAWVAASNDASSVASNVSRRIMLERAD